MENRWVNINTSISADGLGVPVVSIFFSYCDKKDITGAFCHKCQNEMLQEDGVGFNLNLYEIKRIVDDKLSSMKSLLGREAGICFLGGEPTAEINRDMFMKLSEYYKDRFQILYTWRTKDLIEDKWIKYVDKTVCGEYVEKLNVGDDYELGSTNQYVINGKKETILEYKGDG